MKPARADFLVKRFFYTCILLHTWRGTHGVGFSTSWSYIEKKKVKKKLNEQYQTPLKNAISRKKLQWKLDMTECQRNWGKSTMCATCILETCFIIFQKYCSLYEKI